MTSKPKFFYDSGAEHEGGGDAATIEKTETQAPSDLLTTEITKPVLSDDELKTYGFDSHDALKTFLAERKEQSITPEEKTARENIEKANLLKFAGENKLLTVDEYTQYEAVKSKSDKDIVFQGYLREFKADNPEITDPKEAEAAALEEFNYEYKIGDDDTLSKKTEARLSREAKEIRNPIEAKITAAQEQYKENNNLRQTYPKFESFVEEAIKRNTPDKLAVVKIKNGVEEIPVEIELTKEDREAIAKTFKTPKTFQLFTSGKPEEVTAAVDKKMQGWIREHKSVEIASKSFDLGRGVGNAMGSNVGANNPFPLINQQVAQVTGDETLEQSNARIAKERARAQVR